MPPFSSNVRYEIDKRAGNHSELSGISNRPLERMHGVHGSGERNCLENALKGTDIEHFALHHYFREQPLIIGLKKYQNDWSIDAINQRVVTASYNMGRLATLDQEIEIASVTWHELLNNIKTHENTAVRAFVKMLQKRMELV